MFKNLILFATTLGLSACAFDKDSSKVNAKDTADRLRLEQAYKPLANNVYRGTITTDTFQQPIELRLFMLEVKDGKNANGEDRYLKVLQGNLRKTNSVDASNNYNARFISETGELILSNVAEKDLSSDDVHTVNAVVNGDKITGQSITVSGDVGIVDLTLYSNSSSKPGNSESEFNERLRRQYEAIAGTYVGDNVFDGKVNFKATLVLYVLEKEVPNSSGSSSSSGSSNGGTPAPGTKKIRPELMAEFTRSDDPSNDLALLLTSVYQPEAVPAKLIMTGKLGRITNVPYEANFSGVFIDGNYHGSWRSSTRGFQGDFILKKVK